MAGIVITEPDRKKLERVLDALLSGSRANEAIEALEQELGRARVVAPDDVPPDVVTMNSEIELVDLDTHEQMRMRLVFPERADADEGRISVLAPLGLAVLGSRETEELEWPTPGRVRRLRIERVIYQPEAAGDLA
jgi:regulator of nucleoside diphosphate kinase